MDFEFFQRLTPDAASAFLANYIDAERAAVSLFIADAAAAGVSADFSIESLAPLFADHVP